MNLSRSGIILLLALLLSSCGPSPEQQAAQTSTTMTAVAPAWTPTLTATSTNTPTPTETSTPLPTSTPTRRPTSTPVPTPTPDPARYYAPDGTFSFPKLEGWTENESGQGYPSLVLTEAGSQPPVLFFWQEEYPMMLAFYTAVAQDDFTQSFTNVRQVREDFLTTTNGKDYFRWEIDAVSQGTDVHQVYYFYESGDWKLVIVYNRSKNSGSENDPLVDEAMKSVQFKR